MHCPGCHLDRVLLFHKAEHNQLPCSSTKVVLQVDPNTTCAVQRGQSYAGSCLLLSAAKLAPVSVA